VIGKERMAQPDLELQTEKQMGILDHLNELRIYVVRAAIGLAIGTAVAFLFTNRLFEFLWGCNYPALLLDAKAIQAACGEIQAIRPTETIENFFRIAFMSGAGLAMPWIIYQFWRFISPGLHKHEKRYVYIFVPAVTLLFAAGVAFAWGLLLPPALVFLNTFLADNITIQWTVDSYIDFVTGFLFWLGVAFEMPLVFYFLARFGLVSAKMLRENWRFAVVGIAVLAAVITPSIDPVTMLMTMVPLSVLYLASIGLASLGYRQFTK
jgi:sec-independent protein translocase protein TatC